MELDAPTCDPGEVKSHSAVHRAHRSGPRPAAPQGSAGADTAALSEASPSEASPSDVSPSEASPSDASLSDGAPPDAAPSDAAATDDRPTGPIPVVPDSPARPAGQFTPDGLPKLTRRHEGSILGGVAGGIADHLNVPVLWVRATFAILAIMGGAGILAYALLWIFVPQRRDASPEAVHPAGPLERRQAYGVAALGVALMFAAMALGFGQVLTWVLGPLGLAAVGAAFIWREADDARRARWRRTAAGIVGPSTGSWWRLVGGCLLVVGGLSVFAIGQTDFSAVRSALLAVVLTLVGVAVITIPWWVRLVRDLGDERQGRIREKERAEIGR